MKSKALFIDFDGTICVDRYWQSLPPEQHAQVQSYLFGSDTTLVNDWMRGKHTAEEINQMVSEHLGIAYEKVWSLFVDDCEKMVVPENIRSELMSVRNSYTTVLMTGNMDSFHRFTVPALELEDCFDYISNSYYERKHKTDINGQLFTDWADKLGVLMQDIHLIDDSSQCCEYFTQMGGTAHQTNGLDHTLQILKMLQSL